MNENIKKSFIAVIAGILVGLIPTYGIILDKFTNSSFGIYKSIYLLMNFFTPISGYLVTEFILYALAGIVVTRIVKRVNIPILLLTTIFIVYGAYFLKVVLFSWTVTLYAVFDAYVLLSILMNFVFMWAGSFIYSRFIKSNA